MPDILDMQDSDLIALITQRYSAAEQYSKTWRREAREMYDMVAGDQWSEEDRLKMLEQMRPAVTLNVTGKYLDAIGGLQITNRQEVKFLPRQIGESGVSELLTGAADWVRDETDAEDEESEMFLDMLTCGEGWGEMSITFDTNPQGDISIERRDPMEMYGDPRARKRNRRDARWVMRINRMSKADIIDRWGEKKYEEIGGNTMGIEPDLDELPVHVANEGYRYQSDNADTIYIEDTTPIIHFETFERLDGFRVEMEGHGIKTYTTKQWRKLKKVLEKNGVDYIAEKVKTKQYIRVFAAGGSILQKGLSPYQEGFTFQNITGKRDRNKNNFYGIARNMRDPQMWTNKLFSTILDALAVGSKGGLIAEEGAFTDPAKAEDEWSRPDAITFVEDGALTTGKIQEKAPATYPAGLDRLMTFALGSLPEVSGINLEILGLSNRVQPGVVEMQRKQSAMTMIAWAFDSMRRYYKDHGRQLAYYIREYISDGRLARITTEQGMQYIPLIRDQLTIEFDVVVDEAPTSANVKERVWAVLQGLLPQLIQMGFPIPPDVLNYSPLPPDLADKWKELLNKGPSPQQQQQQQMQMQDKMAEIEKDKSVALLNTAKAQRTMADLTTEQARLGRDAALNMRDQSEVALNVAKMEKTQAETREVAAKTGKIVSGA